VVSEIQDGKQIPIILFPGTFIFYAPATFSAPTYSANVNISFSENPIGNVKIRFNTFTNKNNNFLIGLGWDEKIIFLNSNFDNVWSNVTFNSSLTRGIHNLKLTILASSGKDMFFAINNFRVLVCTEIQSQSGSVIVLAFLVLGIVILIFTFGFFVRSWWKEKQKRKGMQLDM